MARQSNAHRLAALVILCGCGARSGLADVDGADANVEDASIGLDVPRNDDTSNVIEREAESETEAEVDPGPLTCDDVGKYPGVATCCKGKYCEGYCRNKGTSAEVCDCGAIGGCTWPVICCRGTRCVGPSLCSE